MTPKFVAGLLAGFAATAAAAQVPPAGSAPGQRDGVQTRAEAVQRVGAMFGRVDLNHDGVITRAEFDRLHGQHAQHGAPGRRMGERLFAMADRNGDGQVTVAEARGAVLQQFDAADRNRDGVLTRAERQGARQQWGAGRRG